MPRVQQYKQQVTSQVVQGARAPMLPDAAFDTGVQDLLRVGGQAAQVGFQMHERAQTQRAKDAALNFERAENELLFNNETGYFNTNGRNAFDSSDVTRQQLMTMREEYAKGLDGSALDRYNEVVNNRIVHRDRDIMRHASKNLKAWELANDQVEIENTIENAASLFEAGITHQDGQVDEQGRKVPNPLTVQLKRGEMTVMAMSNRQGLSSQATNEALENYRSSFYSSAITQAINSSGNEGEQALEKWGNYLEPQDERKMADLLERKKVNEEAIIDDNIVYSIGQTAANTYTGDVDEALKVINDIDDLPAKLKKRATVEAQRLINITQSEAYDNVVGMINDGRSIDLIKSTRDWQLMNNNAKNRVETGQHMIPNNAEFNRLMTQSPDGIMTVDPNSLTGLLSQSQIADFRKLQDKTAKGDIDQSQKLLKKHAIDQFGMEKHWRDKSGLTKKGEKVNAYMGFLNTQFKAFEQDNKRAPSLEEMEVMINRVNRDLAYEVGIIGLDDVEISIKEDVKPADVYTINTIIDYAPALQDQNGEAFEQFMIKYDKLVDDETDINIFNLMTRGEPITVPDEHELTITRVLDARARANQSTSIDKLKAIYQHLLAHNKHFTLNNIMKAYEQAEN